MDFLSVAVGVLVILLSLFVVAAIFAIVVFTRMALRIINTHRISFIKITGVIVATLAALQLVPILLPPRPIILLKCTATNNIIPATITCENRSEAYDRAEWLFDEEIQGDQTFGNYTHLVDKPGEHTISLRIFVDSSFREQESEATYRLVFGAPNSTVPPSKTTIPIWIETDSSLAFPINAPDGFRIDDIDWQPANTNEPATVTPKIIILPKRMSAVVSFELTPSRWQQELLRQLTMDDRKRPNVAQGTLVVEQSKASEQ